MNHTRLQQIDGNHYLSFDCGGLPGDAAAISRGFEANGHFWESVAIFLAPELCERLELDSEGSMFCAYGSQADLVELQALLDPVLSDEGALTTLIDDAEAQGEELED